MNAQPLPAFEVLMKHEGGFAPEDNGRGAVNMGVTQLTLDGIRARGGYWLKLPENVKDLTRGDVFSIFRDCYWHPSGAWRIHDQRLANAYAGMHFNAWTAATKAIQRAVGVAPDGVFGEVTARAVNSFDPGNVLALFKREMLAHYEHLARENPAKYADDLKDWKKRLEDL